MEVPRRAVVPLVVLLLLWLLVECPCAGAQEPDDVSPSPSPSPSQSRQTALKPDGSKLWTSDPFTVAPGAFSITPTFITSTSSSYYDAGGVRRTDARVEQLFYNLAVTYGVAKNFDVAVTIGDSTLLDKHNEVVDPEGIPGPVRGAGLADLTLNARWRFYDSDDLTAAHILSVVVPTGANEGTGRLGLTQGYTSVSYRIVGSKTWGQFNLNADLAVYGVIGHHSSTTTASANADVALGWQATSWLQPIVELNYLSTYYDSGPPSQALAAALGAEVKLGDFAVDVGAQQTVAGRNANNTLSTTFSVSYGF